MKRLPTFDPAEILNGHLPLVDFHIHTSYTDGNDTIEACVVSAIEMGLSSIAFCEHVSRNKAWLDNWFQPFLDEISRCKDTYPQIKIYSGVEAKVTDYYGALNLLPEQLHAVDFVMGVVHTYPDNSACNTASGQKEHGEEQSRFLEVRASLALLDNPQVDVIGHAGAVYGKTHRVLPVSDYKRIIEKAASNGIAFEINSRYHKPVAIELLRICTTYGARVTLGSDAHSSQEVGDVIRDLRKALNL